MTLWAAAHGIADRYIIADSFAPMVELWRAIINEPKETADLYAEIWNGQRPGDNGYFNRVRERYNFQHNPVDLLYLICRCVKNAVRFNREGVFTQSVDKRRLGMRPDKMMSAISAASTLLRKRGELRQGDWTATTIDATTDDFVYMDPPYLGTTIGRDKRYAEQLPRERLIAGLHTLILRRVRFALSYDGMTGGREYGPPLPDDLRLTRYLLHAGKSSQSTLNGRQEDTIESLYLSPGLAPSIGGLVGRRGAHQPALL